MNELLSSVGDSVFLPALTWDSRLEVPITSVFPSYFGGTLPDDALLTSRLGFGDSYVVDRVRERLEIWVADSAPKWLHDATEQIVALLRLEADWDSYGAQPVRFQAAIAALDLMLELIGESTCPPSIVPTVDGGIQIEWHVRGIDLEIEMMDFRNASLFVYDSETEVEWEGKLIEKKHELPGLFARLSG